MPQVVTHILVPIILLSLFRDYFIKNKQKFPLHYVLIGGIAGILPDIDIGIYYVLGFFGYSINEIHRIFSHNLFLVAGLIILGFLFLEIKNKELGKHHLKLSTILFVIAFGVLIHILLDFLIAGDVALFYPFSSGTFGLNLVWVLPVIWQETIIPVIDAILLTGWLIYMEVKHKISDFI